MTLTNDTLLAKMDSVIKQGDFGIHDLDYYNFHRIRYSYLIRIINNLIGQNKHLSLLDIGPSFQTIFFDSIFEGIELDTLGFLLEQFMPRNNPTLHTEYDLSNSGTNETVLASLHEKYDLIILAEVIEHMYIKPEKVMNMLHSLLKPGGYLIIQTPNAAFIGNRIKLLLGKNPNSWIRDEPHNPGHYREYTRKELIDLGKRTGYEVNSITGNNYFSHPSRIKQMALNLTRILPQTMKNGFTVILQKPI